VCVFVREYWNVRKERKRRKKVPESQVWHQKLVDGYLPKHHREQYGVRQMRV
jgi:hypothetical protein